MSSNSFEQSSTDLVRIPLRVWNISQVQQKLNRSMFMKITNINIDL